MRLVRVLLGVVLVFACVPVSGAAGDTALSPLRVSGHQLIDAGGDPVVLRGVNRAGTEYMCAQDRGIADGPTDRSSIDAIRSWRANAVRIPLNEHCWLGIDDGAPTPAFIGEPYRQAVDDFVERLLASGLYAILDLHWSAPAGQPADGQMPMPNTSYTAEFWSSVADRFKGDDRVIFDLFNEPVPNDNVNDGTETTARRSWECWRDGGTASCDASFSLGKPGTSMTAGETVGMQALVDAVRATGATNVIMLGGIQWANTLWSSSTHNWLAYKPADPIENLAASVHVHAESWCVTTSCYDTEVAPVAAQVPVITGEVGIAGCDAAAAAWLTALLSWLDARQIGYLGWTWNIVASGQDPCIVRKLVADYAGTATVYGEIYRTHLAGLPVRTATTLSSSAAPSDEGEVVTFTATVSGTLATDVPSGTVVFDVDGNVLTATLDGTGRAHVAVGFADDCVRHIVARYSGSAHFTPSVSAALTQVIQNRAPTIGTIAGIHEPVSVGTVLTVSAAFADQGVADTHAAQVRWGDGTLSNASISESSGSGTLTATHAYVAAGIYTVEASVADDDGASNSARLDPVVVFDPSAGSLRGTGWYESPAGAHTSEPAAAGRATFGVLARYRDDATRPAGQPGFRLRTARIAFASTDHEWLVVTGETAQLRGSGVVEGGAQYAFQLWVVDGRLGEGGEDRLRIRIWDPVTGEVVYDTQMGAPDSAKPDRALGGGSITVGQGAG